MNKSEKSYRKEQEHQQVEESRSDQTSRREFLEITAVGSVCVFGMGSSAVLSGCSDEPSGHEDADAQSDSGSDADVDSFSTDSDVSHDSATDSETSVDSDQSDGDSSEDGGEDADVVPDADPDEGPEIGPNDVYLVRNGDCFDNISMLFEMMGGISTFIDPTDVVVIKGNAQWPRQGYTHTGCIKAVIDEILAIPGFSGEILICDNIQSNTTPGTSGFDTADRGNNWPDHNWNSLAEDYQGRELPVSTKQWFSGGPDRSGPADGLNENGIGWVRDYFKFRGMDVMISYPYFESPINPGRIIDMQNGVWEGDGYTGRAVKSIFMPTLNNHGWGSEDYAGVTSAIKSFFGATEIMGGDDGSFKGYRHIHSASYTDYRADYAGELVARFINTMYSPDLFITAAMWSGHDSRTGGATETRTVLACRNPVTLDYVACRDVISPLASFLDPDEDNNTRRQITGCISGGIGTIDDSEFTVFTHDFA